MMYEIQMVMLGQSDMVRTCEKFEFREGFLIMHNPRTPYGPSWDETVIEAIPCHRIYNVRILQPKEDPPNNEDSTSKKENPM